MKNRGVRWLSAFPIGAFALAVFILIIALLWTDDTWSRTGAQAFGAAPQLEQALLLSKAQTLAHPDAPLAVYRHSVIPGGVRQSSELTSALARDQFASVHYAKFDAANAYLVHVKAPRLVHVSYRMGDKIFWTKKKVRLPAGEALLTDGKTLVRARCGNRIADTPQATVSDKEPPPGELDMLVVPPRAPLNRTTESTNERGAPTALFSGGFNSVEHFAAPTSALIPGAFPPPSSAFTTPPVTSAPDDSTSSVPEPTSFALVMLALISLSLIRQRIAPNNYLADAARHATLCDEPHGACRHNNDLGKLREMDKDGTE